MSSDNRPHVFVFHGDGEVRPSSGECNVVVAGQPGDEDMVVNRNKEDVSAEEITAIRARSLCIDKCITSNPTGPVHLWPDPSRGIAMSTLRYVVLSLRGEAPLPTGKNQLRELSAICTVLFILKCDRNPFLDSAKSIVRTWKSQQHKVFLAEAKWLTTIHLVFGWDKDIKSLLEHMVWHSNSSCRFPLQYLQEWVDGESHRDYVLESCCADCFRETNTPAGTNL